MNQEDIIINLPENTKLTTLTVAPSFAGYTELLQRAVMLLFTSTRPEVAIGGTPFYQLIRKSTTAGLMELRTLSGHVADGLKRLLGDTEVTSVDLTIGEGSSPSVTINIKKADNSSVRGEFTI